MLGEVQSSGSKTLVRRRQVRALGDKDSSEDTSTCGTRQWPGDGRCVRSQRPSADVRECSRERRGPGSGTRDRRELIGWVGRGRGGGGVGWLELVNNVTRTWVGERWGNKRKGTRRTRVVGRVVGHQEQAPGVPDGGRGCLWTLDRFWSPLVRRNYYAGRASKK